MTITPQNLSRAAGLFAMLAGLLYIGVQFVHPPDTVASVGTTAYVFAEALILPAWAAVLWALGAVLPLLTAFLPHAVGRFAVVPVGVALVGLGFALWSETRGVAEGASAASTAPFVG